MNANRETLTQEVSARLGIPASDCRAVLDALLRAVAASLSRGCPVQLRRFGTWSLRHRKGRAGVRNVRTGEPCPPLPARLVVRFVAAEGMGVQP